MTDFAVLLGALSEANTEFIIVGGVAGTIHGASRLTQDMDVVYRRTAANAERLAQALSPLAPYPRGLPAGLPFRFDASTIRNGSTFTLTTSVGDIDLLGEITSVGGHEAPSE